MKCRQCCDVPCFAESVHCPESSHAGRATSTVVYLPPSSLMLVTQDFWCSTLDLANGGHP